MVDQQIHSVILAAGLSTRMGSMHTNKVCLELLHKPVICRVIEALEKARITSHTVVVGASAGEVMNCVDKSFRNISYAYQSWQRGPADALKCAVDSLPDSFDRNTLLLVVPGHRIISERIIRQLLDFYTRNNLKLAGVFFTGSGLRPPQNLSIYLGKAGDIAENLQKLYISQTTQTELQLTQLADLMNGPDRKSMLEVGDFTDVLGFNNPEQFLQVTELLLKQQGLQESVLPDNEYHRIDNWLDMLNTSAENPLSRQMEQLYGGDKKLIERQQQRLLELLAAARDKWSGEQLVSVIRSPGRVNIMGRHVDHQGGNCNLMTIGYETLIVARRRQDDLVTLTNLNEYFPSAEFSIGALVRDLPWDDWQTLVSSPQLAERLKRGVSWSDYIKAAFLRFQKHFYDRKLCGMDMIVSGNVPMAAGLSSSSTLVVGTAEAIVSANRLDMEPDKLVTLCGEGEWFVGTRGGAADHAAVKLGACNKVVKVSFFDFAVEKMVDFPEDYALIVADSGIKARKSSNAKDQFNHRVSCYRIGLMLLKKLFPQYADRLHHLRDFTCENLGIPLDWLYMLLTHLPEQSTRQELEAMLPEEDLSYLWENHAEPVDKLYPIRGIVIYGLAECARAGRCVNCLENKQLDELGLMMKISHNGDRVVKFSADARESTGYSSDTSNAALQKLIDDLRSGDAQRIEHAQLWRQPGSYRCSLPDIDLMVDLACGVPGVAGAQLAGAGLGGCMMVLVKADAVEKLTEVLAEKYYDLRGSEPQLLHCRPIAGAGAIRF